MQMSVHTASVGRTLVRSSGVAPRPVNVEFLRINSAQQHRCPTHQTITNNNISNLHCSSRSSNDTCRVAAAAAPAAAAAAQATSDSSLRNLAVALAKAADDTKALDIIVLHVEPVVSWTSYMVLCTVMSKPQLLAVLSRIEDAAAEHGLQKQNSSIGSSQWELLDFGSIVCHVFTAEQREYYNLDDFYALAEEVELPFVSATAAVDSGYDQQFVEESSVGGLWSKSL